MRLRLPMQVDPWSGKISHAEEGLDPHSPATDASGPCSATGKPLPEKLRPVAGEQHPPPPPPSRRKPTHCDGDPVQPQTDT